MKRLVWVVIALQLAVLAWVAAEREWIMAKGTTVWLRTAPVDPRDPFRGDFVALEYEIGHPSQDLAEPVKDAFESAYSPLYAQLVTDAGGVARVASFARELPAEGPVIRGRVGTHLQRDWRSNSSVIYGIEKYFVPQGAGHALENRRGERDGWQTPMEVEVALSRTGTAVIKGHRWSGMSVRLDVLEVGENARNTDGPVRRSPKVRMNLRNDTDQTLMLVDNANHCAFSAHEIYAWHHGGRDGNALKWSKKDCTNWYARDLVWVVLSPQAVYSVEFDFSSPEWFVNQEGKDIEIGEIGGWSSQYRLVYSPPEVDLPEGSIKVWLSPLQSAAFNAGGRID